MSSGTRPVRRSNAPLAKTPASFVAWFRSAAPYIHAFRGRTFVVAFGGEVVASERCVGLVHDFNLLHSLGVRLVLVHGARPQIEDALARRGIESRYVRGARVTDRASLDPVIEAMGRVRAELEAKLSQGLTNSPMANARIRVAGGNFVVARPLGVLEGEDMQHTGEVRRVDAEALRARLAAGDIVLLSALGYSPTGEIFNLTLEEVATRVAIAIKADKLIFMTDVRGVEAGGRLRAELSTEQATQLLRKPEALAPDIRLYLPCAVQACEWGVARAHLVSEADDGAILQELFTREGVGTMVSHGGLHNLRRANIDDVGGILAIIEPLEADGTLVRRSRELLEREIERFFVVEHDGTIVGCAGLYPFREEKSAELAGLAVHPDFRRAGHGEALLNEVEKRARALKLKRLFVLTTRTSHWFLERGFRQASVDELPAQKQQLYNWQRRSHVYVKPLRGS